MAPSVNCRGGVTFSVCSVVWIVVPGNPGTKKPGGMLMVGGTLAANGNHRWLGSGKSVGNSIGTYTKLIVASARRPPKSGGKYDARIAGTPILASYSSVRNGSV